MRRRRVGATAPAPAATVAVVEPPAPAPTTAVATVAAMPLALHQEAADLFAYTPPERAIVGASEWLRVPTIRFFSGSEGKQGGELTAAIIGQALGNVAVGTPYLLGEKQTILPITGTVLVQLAEYQYWATHDVKNQRGRVWLNDPGREVDGLKVAECVIALQVLLPGAQALHDELRPAQVTLTTYKKAQSSPPTKLEKAIAAAGEKEWVTKHPELAEVFVRARVCASLTTKPGTTKPNAQGESFGYVVANAIVRACGPDQLAALDAWWNDDACREELLEGKAAFAEEQAAVEAGVVA